jgi:hypothetical protein
METATTSLAVGMLFIVCVYSMTFYVHVVGEAGATITSSRRRAEPVSRRCPGPERPASRTRHFPHTPRNSRSAHSRGCTAGVARTGTPSWAPAGTLGAARRGTADAPPVGTPAVYSLLCIC